MQTEVIKNLDAVIHYLKNHELRMIGLSNILKLLESCKASIKDMK